MSNFVHGTGYAFLLFRDEIAVRRLVKTCVAEDGKLFMFVSSVTQTHKKVCVCVLEEGKEIVLYSENIPFE